MPPYCTVISSTWRQGVARYCEHDNFLVPCKESWATVSFSRTLHQERNAEIDGHSWRGSPRLRVICSQSACLSVCLPCQGADPLTLTNPEHAWTPRASGENREWTGNERGKWTVWAERERTKELRVACFTKQTCVRDIIWCRPT